MLSMFSYHAISSRIMKTNLGTTSPLRFKWLHSENSAEDNPTKAAGLL